MMTIFTIPKPFTGHNGVIQENAIASWTRLRPACEIVLVGDEAGTAEIAARYGARRAPGLRRNAQGTPLLDSIFQAAERAATKDVMCYVNADIILTHRFTDIVSKAHERRPDAVLMGRRVDMELPAPIDFSGDWEAPIRAHLARTKVTHRGIDYVVFPKGTYENMPPFAIGRLFFDNWLVWYPNRRGRPTIDLTDAFQAIHSNHDYGHHAQGKTGAYEGAEVERNQQLLGRARRMHTTLDARYRLTIQGLRPNRRWVPLAFFKRVRIIIIFYYFRRVLILSHRHRALRPLVRVVRFLHKLPRRVRSGAVS